MTILDRILEYITCIFIGLGIMTVVLSILTLVSITYELDKLQIINILPL